jgi:hypothetical protein
MLKADSNELAMQRSVGSKDMLADEWKTACSGLTVTTVFLLTFR